MELLSWKEINESAHCVSDGEKCNGKNKTKVQEIEMHWEKEQMA